MLVWIVRSFKRVYFSFFRRFYMFLILVSKKTINKYTNFRDITFREKSYLEFKINNYTFLKIFFDFSQRIRHLRIRISILSKFQKNLSSSFLKCGGIRSLSQRYYPRICPMRLIDTSKKAELQSATIQIIDHHPVTIRCSQ